MPNLEVSSKTIHYKANINVNTRVKQVIIDHIAKLPMSDS